MEKSGRIAYIDVAKGILILCLLYGHMLIELKWHGVDNSMLNTIMWKGVYVYNTFFMQTFFLITGLCSSFHINFSLYLWKNIKTLILPAIAITLIGYLGTDINNGFPITIERILSLGSWLYVPEAGPWFIIALFLAKIIYWPVSRMAIRKQLAVIMVLYFIGLLLKTVDLIPNILWHRHTLMMMPFLFAGNMLKYYMSFFNRYMERLALAAIVLIPLQVILLFCTHYDLPMHDRNIGVSIYTFPIHFVNVVLGTSFIFWISRKLQNNQMLKTYGMGSLLIYLINEPQQRFVLKFLMPIYNPKMSYLLCTLFDFGAYLACVVLFYIVVKLVYGNKFLSYLVGKW